MIHFSVTKCFAGKIVISSNSSMRVCVRCSIRVMRSRVSQKNSRRIIVSLELGHISSVSPFMRNIPGFHSAVERVNCTMTSSWMIFSRTYSFSFSNRRHCASYWSTSPIPYIHDTDATMMTSFLVRRLSVAACLRRSISSLIVASFSI